MNTIRVQSSSLHDIVRDNNYNKRSSKTSVRSILLEHLAIMDQFLSRHFVHTTHVTSFCVSYGGQGSPLHFTSTRKNKTPFVSGALPGTDCGDWSTHSNIVR